MYKIKPLFAFIKRLFDILSSLIALIILSPLFLILIILVKVDSKAPAFYGHKRVGKNGKVFKAWKFRSMRRDDRPLEEILSPEQLEE
jgi:Sugar transferases involved in lipopolysaccharide synthesis